MELSVVIVNYNVRRYLRQCLESLRAALRPFGAGAEVWVVDNASADSSRAFIEEWRRAECPDFPLHWIDNAENVGFARANNQAVQRASGRFLLFLNPDTVVSPEVLERCRRKMALDPLCGGIGVKMLNARGRFLPESKRGFPDPWASFCKLTGVYRLFPRVRSMNRYYMSWLSEGEEQRVEVLAGAFMYVRRTPVLDAEGYFDERFFMYGEDIDLSYRIGRGTAYCAYLPEPILHYKGESTDSSSFRYTRVFYQAMELFLDKYYGRSLSALLLRAGIRLVAAAAAAKWLVSAAGNRKKRSRKPGKALQLFWILSARASEVAQAVSPEEGDVLFLSEPLPLGDGAVLAGKLRPRLEQGVRVHLVLDTEHYGYGEALSFLGSPAWQGLQRVVAGEGGTLCMAFASGREPSVVIAEER